MPVARLVGARERTTVYGLTAVDGRGRVADRTVTQALGWQPGNPLSIRVTNGLIIVAAADGPVAVSNQRRVHLPAAARHACRIAAGDRVLLAAEPDDGLLVVHPLATLDAMVAGLRDQLKTGEAA
jgi:bifunctional DNA-binding transcriptional regulator/antitoxin component of YhaV-PrlF toxin-antitoxin module